MRLPWPKNRDPFARAPFLFPWYAHGSEPLVFRKGEKLSWRHLDPTDNRFGGVTALESAIDLFGLIKIYTYVFPSIDNEAFCIWNRSYKDELEGSDLRIDIFDASALRPISRGDEVLSKFNEDEKNSYLIGSEPRATLSIPLPNNLNTFSHQISDELTGFDSFIVVTGIKGLYSTKNEAHNTALVEIFPAENRIHIYPQDWFNLDGTIDFGYQWITRAVREAPRGRILGQGIRISNFELDDTNRELMKI